MCRWKFLAFSRVTLIFGEAEDHDEEWEEETNGQLDIGSQHHHYYCIVAFLRSKLTDVLLTVNLLLFGAIEPKGRVV